jgi:hypothetical protein
VRPIFSEASLGMVPSATPKEVASAIFDAIDAGARLLNVDSLNSWVLDPGSASFRRPYRDEQDDRGCCRNYPLVPRWAADDP